MARVYSFLLLAALTARQIEGLSLTNWFWGKSEESTVLVADGVPLVSIPYESMTDDEKFLQEAAKFTEIQVSSPLETCLHKVIMKIRTSCADMSEEELAKLSVNLLNCQSAVEGRKMFPCTEEMSLKQCTTDMDADMWNAYHLMSNRARAVCYAARSTQFRALTELTVNKLMQAAHSQLHTLGSLKASQDRLEEQTTEALSSLSEGNKALLEQQEHLRDAQATAHKLVSTNLRDLYNEKALIRSGHTQLATLAQDIRNKLEKASQELNDQAMERGTNHQQVLDDLASIQEQVKIMWDKIEAGTDRLIGQHEDATKQYEETLQKLTQINDTIQFIWNVTNAMRTEVDEKLGWITAYIGDTGEQLERVYRITLHIVYLLFAMIIAAFIDAPFLTRATIMGIVPINLLSYLKHGMEACLDFTSITALIFLIGSMHFVMIAIQRVVASKTEETVKFVEHNGVSNGHAHKYATSSPSVSKPSNQPKASIFAKLKTSLQGVPNTIQSQISHCAEKVTTIVRSAISWVQLSWSSTPREELSCSYTSSKKHREDLICDYGDYPSMSDDCTDFEQSDVVSDAYDNYPQRLRHRVASADSTYVRNTPDHPRMHQTSSPTRSRSNTPSYAAPRVLCNAYTRSGRKCRLVAVQGRDFCSRHTTGSSIMGD